MPAVSERQKRAMYAARAGNSRLGIPRDVGAEFVGKDADPGNGKHAAGVVYVAPDGDVLLLRRTGTPGVDNFVGHWSLPGGGGDAGETPEQTARRESIEEMGNGVPEGPMRAINRKKTPTGMIFHTFAQPVEQKFVPALNDEHSGFAWAPLDMLPQPLHPAVADALGGNLGAAEDMTPDDWKALRDGFAKWTREEEAEEDHAERGKLSADERAAAIRHRVAAGANDALAMDWAARLDSLEFDGIVEAHRRAGMGRLLIAFDRESVRRVDADGRLHVDRANISKAAVNEYFGREIPDFEELRLDPNRRYRLLRDPEELKKAASTFNNLPLLSTHEAVSAEDHKPDLIVGAIGTDAKYEHPFLTNSLVVWAKEGIDGVQSNEQKELSCSYRYRADMTPGEFEGQKFDGTMRDLVGNHVALVKKGRAGPDVVVGDSDINEGVASMKKLTRTGLFISGAIAASLTPMMAKDQALDMSAVLAKVEAGKSLKESKIAIIDGAKKLKLAKDASIEDFSKMLDSLEKKVDGVDAEMESSDPMIAGGEEDEAMDDGVGARIAEYLKGCMGRALTEEDIAKVAELASAPAAQDADETEEEKKARLEKEAKEKANDDAPEKKPEMVSKKAMDAALAAVAAGTEKSVTQKVLKIANDIAIAREAVEPYVGKLSPTVAFDSAEQVFEQALKMRNIDTKEIHPSAFKAVLEAQPKQTALHRSTQLAQDAEPSADFAQHFPAADRIRVSA